MFGAEQQPEGDVVFGLWVDSTGEDQPMPLPVFRAEHFPPIDAA